MRKALAAAAGVLLLLLAGAAYLSWPDGNLPPSVSIAGVPVGGHSVEDAERMLRAAAAQHARAPIVFRWPGGRLSLTGSQLGAAPNLEVALERARTSRGRLSVLGARLGLNRTKQIPLSYRFGPRALDALVAQLRSRIDRPPRPATLEFRGPKLALVRSRPGRSVDATALTTELAALPHVLEVPTRVLMPRVRERQALAVRARTERLLEHPPAVIYKTTRADLDVAFLRRALRFEPRGARLAVLLDPELLERRLMSVFRAFERQPRDAVFDIEGSRVTIVSEENGLELDVRRIARELVARAGETQLLARFRSMLPQFTTAEAQKLRIRELVSEFTTPYPCCAPRVTNIQRAAALLDSTIIPVGGTFSLNEALGERTRERGFVEAPMIVSGRLVDAVGGGVSQISTTLYNAAFFAGLDLVEHVPHEFYISRYPMGREATVSWGWPDLVLRNDWPAAVLVKASADPTSVTIRFYSSTLGRRVETETGEPNEHVPARTRTVLKRSLPPGTRQVVQHGGIAGFTVSYTRRVYRGAKLLRDERWTVRYRPEDTIVEIGPPKPKPKPEPTPKQGEPRGERPPLLDRPR